MEITQCNQNHQFVYNATSQKFVLQNRKKPKLRSQWDNIVESVANVFLPIGYPNSVAEEYTEFQVWDTIQAMCSYLRGVLATQSVLESVGVGDESKSALAAAIMWIFRDGSGMVGGLLFVYAVGPKLDVNVKFWRLFADLINDVALTLDMLAPLAGAYGMKVLIVSSICKTLCGVSAGSTRASLTAHFAKSNNMADISAKEGTQETAVTLLGLTCGMYFASLVNVSSMLIWASFLSLTTLHVYANFKAVSVLQLPTINAQRAVLLWNAYLRHDEKPNHLSIRNINRQENVLHTSYIFNPKVLLGARMEDISMSYETLQASCRILSKEAYLLFPSNGYVYGVLKSNAQPKDELKAYLHGVELCALLHKHPIVSHEKAIASTYHAMHSNFEKYLKSIQNQHWHTDQLLLGAQKWRYVIS